MTFDPSAQFRRSGQRDDRRRRLLTDEAATQGEASGDLSGRRRAAPRHKSEHYGDAEFLDKARRVVDLVPRGLVAWLFLVLAGVTLIVGLEALYASLPDLCAAGQTITAFDLAAEGSLATWFSSLTLLGAASAALVVYAVRRHRTDDYRGRYRLWLGVAGCWFLLATDEAASLHEAFQTLAVSLSGTALVGDGAIWWIMTYALFGGAIGLRTALDMRESRLSLTVFILATAAFVADVLFRLNVVVCPTATARVMAIEGAEMAAYLLLFAAMGLYARHVLLDAEGLLGRKAKAKKAKPATAPKEDSTDRTAAADTEDPLSDSTSEIRRDPAHPIAAPKSAAVAAQATVTTASDASTDEETDAAGKLSKAERKAMKDKLLRERLKREQEKRSKWK